MQTRISELSQLDKSHRSQPMERRWRKPLQPGERALLWPACNVLKPLRHDIIPVDSAFTIDNTNQSRS